MAVMGEPMGRGVLEAQGGAEVSPEEAASEAQVGSQEVSLEVVKWEVRVALAGMEEVRTEEAAMVAVQVARARMEGAMEEEETEAAKEEEAKEGGVQVAAVALVGAEVASWAASAATGEGTWVESAGVMEVVVTAEAAVAGREANHRRAPRTRPLRRSSCDLCSD